jgi:hypothetical protein
MQRCGLRFRQRRLGDPGNSAREFAKVWFPILQTLGEVTAAALDPINLPLSSPQRVDLAFIVADYVLGG